MALKSYKPTTPGQRGLVLLSVDPDTLGNSIKWEPSRGGQLFPHLYGSLGVSDIIRADVLELDTFDKHIFPDDILEG